MNEQIDEIHRRLIDERIDDGNLTFSINEIRRKTDESNRQIEVTRIPSLKKQKRNFLHFSN